jgi:putative transposase
VLLVDGIGWPSIAAWGARDHAGRHKVPLALAEGATENATVPRDLLAGLCDRGLEVTRPILVMIDGANACAARRWRCSTTR